MQKTYEWQWPSLGASPSHEGLDSEIFDTEKFPHAHTFVREAIQNILDARADSNSPATARFEFHESTNSVQNTFLEDLIDKRKHCKLGWPDKAGSITWLTIEDDNTTGLLGELTDRKSDFWGYWLNFGRSNKSGSGRGGRGIGRVTFLLASKIHTVLGITKRTGDNEPVCCGMSVLRADDWKGAFRSSFAYFAAKENGNIFTPYKPHVAEQLAEAFRTEHYSKAGSVGLSLIVPYPRAELTEETICAAAIENFAPAIIAGDLVVGINERSINSHTIKDEAYRISQYFRNQSFKEHSASLIDLLSNSFRSPDYTIDVPHSNLRGSILDALAEELRSKIFDHYQDEEAVTLKFNVPVIRNAEETTGSIMACVRVTPYGQTPTDIFYRGGMYLPDVATKSKGNIDAIFMTEEDELNKYLNFCEGKAHLGLLENSEVKDKLLRNGFDDNVTLKRFVNTLPAKVRTLVQPDSSEPDATVFANWFAVGKVAENKKNKRKKKKVVIDVPPSREKYFLVDRLETGFRIRANPKKEKESWPMNLRIRFAYASSNSKPTWSKHDFRITNLKIEWINAEALEHYESEIEKKAGLDLINCSNDFSTVVQGFDIRRELIVFHQPLKSETVEHG